jgi:hypothetical protein
MSPLHAKLGRRALVYASQAVLDAAGIQHIDNTPLLQGLSSVTAVKIAGV